MVMVVCTFLQFQHKVLLLHYSVVNWYQCQLVEWCQPNKKIDPVFLWSMLITIKTNHRYLELDQHAPECRPSCWPMSILQTWSKVPRSASPWQTAVSWLIGCPDSSRATSVLNYHLPDHIRHFDSLTPFPESPTRTVHCRTSIAWLTTALHNCQRTVTSRGFRASNSTRLYRARLFNWSVD